MSRHNDQAQRPPTKTTLITVRVSREQRDALHRMAANRGETLSRMLLSPWLRGDGRKRVKRSAKTESHVVATANAAPADACLTAPADACVTASVGTRGGVDRVRAWPVVPAVKFGVQGALFGDIAGDL